MISLVLYVLAAIAFFAAGANQTIFSQPELDEIAWGLFFIVLAKLLGGWGPPAPWARGDRA